MDFFALKGWLKAHDLTFKLEGWSGCIPDTILIFQGNKEVYEGDYNSEVDYQKAVDEIKKTLAIAE